jgi:hypothetical protein
MAVQTISAQVRELEKALGHQLLKPLGRGVALTEAGQAAFADVGIMLDGTDRLVVVDIDHCVDAASNIIDPTAMKLLHDLDAQYIEISPSGNGLRAFGYSEPLETGVDSTYDGLHVEL